MSPYLEKNAWFPAQIIGAPHPDLGMVVVIPAYLEPDLLDSLSAILACVPPKAAVEVIVVINDGERDEGLVKKQNEESYQAACAWGRQHSSARLKFHFLYHSNLPAKHAGVGLARKIGMDEAVYRLLQAQRDQGIICCFDADASCDPSYLRAIERTFVNQPRLQAASIYFEHPLTGTAFPEKVYEAIAQYELHLRYYVQAQRWSGFPFAQQTIGSSMAVRCTAYQQQGGMNKRKAGEDFYFLQKFIPLGHFTEINTTRVIPSPRISNRVPFGTGKAIGQLIQDGIPLTTYAPRSFKDLQVFFAMVPQFFSAQKNKWSTLQQSLPASIKRFLELADFENKLTEIRQHTSSKSTFEQRFYRWFNAFTLMKFMHFSRDNFYDNVPIEMAAHWLLKEKKVRRIAELKTARELLAVYRRMDRKRKN